MAQSPTGRGYTSSKWSGSRLIRTKLFIPQPQPNWVPRPRLLARLQYGLRQPLTLLSAPAGFGKTTLLAEWVGACRSGAFGHTYPVAWLSLDSRDNDLLRFLTYLLAAFDSLGIQPDEEMLTEVSPLILEDLLAALINQAAERPHPFVLVLDDYHQITNEKVHETLAFLLAHIPVQMHLVLSSRAEPPLALNQMRARGQMVELRAHDLRFSIDEAQDFLNRSMGLNLSREMAALLDRQTEGWAAALQLAALAIKSSSVHIPGQLDADHLHEYIEAFRGNHRYIVDYLVEQVLDSQAEQVQSFLLQTSILDRLCSPLCDALLNGNGFGESESQSMLEYLERSNLFLIPLDGERQWYRYHPLFAGLLRDRLQQSEPELWQVLHRRATEWYERNGFIPEAVDHALTVGDAEQAASLVAQVAETIWAGGEIRRLKGWLESLPDEMMRLRPRLCIYHAWILNVAGETRTAEERLRAAEIYLKSRQEIPAADYSITQGMLLATRAILAIPTGDYHKVIHYCHQSLKLLPQDSLIWRSVVIRNLGNAYLLAGETQKAEHTFRQAYDTSQAGGSLYMALVSYCELAELQLVQGRLYDAAQTCQQALKLIRDHNPPSLTVTGALHVALSEVQREWNEMEAAIENALAGIEYGRQGRSVGVMVCGYTRLGFLYRIQGDEAAAQDAFQHALQLAPTEIRTSFLAHHDIQARLRGTQGSAATAYWVHSAGLHPEGEINYFNETAYLTLARAYLDEEQWENARRLLERMLPVAEAGQRYGRVLEILVLSACACYGGGQIEPALEYLGKALVLAEPRGYVRLFLDAGRPVADLCTRLDPGHPGSAYAQRLLALFPTGSQAILDEPADSSGALSREQKASVEGQSADTPEPLVEPLSEREMDILRLIAAGLANHEIARRLVLAPSTVHWHTKNIYSKLNVHSRTQAVARARQLSMLVCLLAVLGSFGV